MLDENIIILEDRVEIVEIGDTAWQLEVRLTAMRDKLLEHAGPAKDLQPRLRMLDRAIDHFSRAHYLCEKATD